ncbi:hypothetical protein D3C81_1083070 [compost metagenome]
MKAGIPPSGRGITSTARNTVPASLSIPPSDSGPTVRPVIPPSFLEGPNSPLAMCVPAAFAFNVIRAVIVLGLFSSSCVTTSSVTSFAFVILGSGRRTKSNFETSCAICCGAFSCIKIGSSFTSSFFSTSFWSSSKSSGKSTVVVVVAGMAFLKYLLYP